ncbi:unnamed protein product [Phytophthora fragariaefolia]|uniref:non-specific serine/threonine protein kinase n=1 Tax=Phytophthora fragariaefolia TaxID=1490495 RepID=A0A9W6XR67_9STRA|nr:unnamed protein product [Phytophthora fragariaefolia]
MVLLGRMMCLNEVVLLQQLPEHSNVVKFREAFWTLSADGNEQTLVIILEHADGGDLEVYLQAHKLPALEDEACRIFIQIALGVHHLHANGVMHRDLKCGNVLLFQSGRVVLGDFGTSKVVTPNNHEPEAQSLTSTVVGSPLYMSPEMLESEPHGFATDIWSLGCVLYELLSAGKHAFAAPSYAAVVSRVTQGKYDPLYTVSYQAQDLISRMLHKTAHQRPSITDVLQSPWLQKYGPAEDLSMKTIEKPLTCKTRRIDDPNGIATSNFPVVNIPPPAPLVDGDHDKIIVTAARKELLPSPPPVPELRSRKSRYSKTSVRQRNKETRAHNQNQVMSPLIRVRYKQINEL